VFLNTIFLFVGNVGFWLPALFCKNFSFLTDFTSFNHSFSIFKAFLNFV